MLDALTLDEFWDLFLQVLGAWPDERDLPNTQKDGEALVAVDPRLRDAFARLEEGSGKLVCNTITGVLKQFNAVVKVEGRQEALEMFAKIAASRRPKMKEVKPRPKKVTHGFKGKDIGELYEIVCYYDAVLDLLTGQLHRLDPVIGDAGCQWRVPFVLDLHGFMSKEVVEKFGGLDAMRPSIEGYLKFRSVWSCREILQILAKAKIPNSDSYDLVGSDFLQYLMDFKKNLEGHCPGYAKIVSVFELAIESFKKDRDLDLDFKKYLKLCKLFTTNRVRQMDVFGLSGIQIELSLPHTKKDFSENVAALGEFSVKYMRKVLDFVAEFEEDAFKEPLKFWDVPISVATVDLLKNQNLFKTSQQSATFDTHVFYGPFRSLFVYQWHRDQPIIIDLRRLSCRVHPSDPEKFVYKYNGGAILYFEPGKGGFTYVENPDPGMINKVGMCVECYSIYREDLPIEVGDKDQAFFTPDFSAYITHVTQRCAIVDLLLCAASTHAELPLPIRKPVSGSYQPDELDLLVEELYGKSLKQVNLNLEGHYLGQTIWQLTDGPIPLLGAKSPEWDLVAERRLMRKVMRDKFKLETTAYKEYLPGDERHPNRSRALRISNHVPFAPIHIYGCTYAIKRWELAQLEERLKRDGSIISEQLINNDNCKPKDD